VSEDKLRFLSSKEMGRILDWEVWKAARQVPNRKRLKSRDQYLQEVDAALEEESSDEEMDDDDA
jgi:hypothetical protein